MPPCVQFPPMQVVPIACSPVQVLFAPGNAAHLRAVWYKRMGDGVSEYDS